MREEGNAERHAASDEGAEVNAQSAEKPTRDAQSGGEDSECAGGAGWVERCGLRREWRLESTSH